MILTFAFGLMLTTLGQKATMELTFTAENNGEYVPLDSIFIENLTQGVDTTLYAPDTIMVLDYYVTGNSNDEIFDVNSFSVSQNYPNPIQGKTTIDVNLPEDDEIHIIIRDIIGKALVKNKFTLKKGIHSFVFYTGSEMYYLLTVTGKQTSKTIKMLNANNNAINTGNCKIVLDRFKENAGYKSYKAVNGFMFSIGDELRYSGYANTMAGILGNGVITDEPPTNTDYVFMILKGIRCQGENTVTDIDGNIYNNVQIGSQCWMKESLRTTTYQNGTSIPNVTDYTIWASLTTSAYSWYQNDPSWKEVYGALYNWYAAIDENNICPSGWHIPTNDEWNVLTDFIGGTIAPYGNELKSCRQQNSPLGGECNTNTDPRWDMNNAIWGTDDYGFSGLPAGGRSPDGGQFGFMGLAVGWWSSTEVISGGNTNAYLLGVRYDIGNVINDAINPQGGYSVRCLRD